MGIVFVEGEAANMREDTGSKFVSWGAYTLTGPRYPAFNCIMCGKKVEVPQSKNQKTCSGHRCKMQLIYANRKARKVRLEKKQQRKQNAP